jgi:hypothetical protein
MDKNDIKKAFREGNLLVRSMDRMSGVIGWRPVQDVMRHTAIGKSILRVTTSENASVTVTEDHSLFDAQGKDVRTSELFAGDWILVNADGVAEQRELAEVKEVESREYMYDLAVPGDENFVLDSGIIAHNSYSVSGVSLDIEKSSKYQAMKDEYIAEYDKLVEAAKQSIKIIKGLRQFRYGIGISSALGPLSRPGVQSRRNWVSPDRSTWV